MQNNKAKHKKHINLLAFRKYILFFIMYAVFGWIYEVFLEVVVYKWGFSNRGFLFGPYLPIYGIGALVFIFFFYPIIKNKKLNQKIIWIIPVFIGCMVSATLLELLTSYLMEWRTGSWPWKTYIDYDINFQGRIALSPSIRFGLGGVFFLYILQPIFEKIVGIIKNRHLTIASITVVSILIIDLIYAVLIK